MRGDGEDDAEEGNFGGAVVTHDGHLLFDFDHLHVLVHALRVLLYAPFQCVLGEGGESGGGGKSGGVKGRGQTQWGGHMRKVIQG